MTVDLSRRLAMHLIDTHTHLDFPDFDTDRVEVLAACRAAGVQRVVVLGVEQANWQRVWDVVLQQDELYAALGLHPVYLERHGPAAIAALEQWLTDLAGHPKLCAVGECGLDYFIETLDRTTQRELLETQIRLAARFELPVLLHVRRAHADTLALLKRIRPARGGIVHAFAGSLEEAREYIKLGFYLGLGGAATWPQALRLHKMVAQLPLEAIVLETDSPDMAPSMHAYRRNSPQYLPDICAHLAQLRAMPPADLAAASSANAMHLFAWH